MKIYTKTGDLGETSLFSGSRVSKSNPRVEIYGRLDSLNAHLGHLKALIVNDCKVEHRADLKTQIEVLLQIQRSIFEISAQVANEKEVLVKESEIVVNLVSLLEMEMDKMDLSLPVLKNFILPGGGLSSSYAQVCRTVTRDIEREVVAKKEDVSDRLNLDGLIMLLNRLSDYLFVLSRLLVLVLKDEEIVWKKS